MLAGEYNLIEEARQGGAEAFGALYDHYAKPIYRYIYLKISDKTLTEDITHEVFLSAWQNIHHYNFQGLPFSSWLYQIARNRVIDYYRTHRDFLDVYEVKETAGKLISQPVNPDHGLDLERVKQALNQLSDDQKEVIVLRFINDLSPPEIAVIMGKSEGAIRLIQYRAINHLKKILND